LSLEQLSRDADIRLAGGEAPPSRNDQGVDLSRAKNLSSDPKRSKPKLFRSLQYQQKARTKSSSLLFPMKVGRPATGRPFSLPMECEAA
jgi:hypothetical protein